MPLDEALAQAVVDVSGRPYFVHTGEPAGQEYALIGGGNVGVPYIGSLTRHVLESLAFHAHLCLHVRVLSGRDAHHIVEAQFKAVARACGTRSRTTRACRVCRARRARCSGEALAQARGTGVATLGADR